MIEFLIAFTSGIVAAFSPCVIALIPIILYRFHEKIEPGKIFQMTMGFLGSFVIIGLFLEILFTSNVQSGIKMGFGFLFAALGILSLLERLNPMDFPLFKHPFLLGISFAGITAMSPCTIPLLALNATAESAVNMMFFGMGLLTPAIMFTIFGNSVLKIANRRLLAKLNKALSAVLIVTGLYLAASISSFGPADSYVVALMLIIILIIFLRAFFIVRKIKDLKKPANLLLIFSIILIIISGIIRCSDTHTSSGTCGADGICHQCLICLAVFGTALLTGLAGIFVLNHFKK